MAKKDARINSKLTNVVQLISEKEASEHVGEAYASLLMNPTVVWAKFILTDDRTNANSQRVPEEEFDNLMTSGIHMPVKMAYGEIKQGHEDSKPLGVITHLTRVLDEAGANAIIALAALWGEERPADVRFIKDKFENGEEVNVSWEILFEDSVYNATTGSEDLLGTTLKAATIVGNPAYKGRTPFLTVAAKKWSNAYVNQLPNSSFLYIDREGTKYFPIADAEGKIEISKVEEALASLGDVNLPTRRVREMKKTLMAISSKIKNGSYIAEVSKEFIGDSQYNVEEDTVDKLEELQAKLAELKVERDNALAGLEEVNGKLTEANAEVERLTKLNEDNETELTELREMKASIEKAEADAAKLDEVKRLFVEAGIEKEDEYFTANAERLVSLSEEDLDFMVTELKAFAEASTTKKNAKSSTKIPVLNGEGGEEEMSPKDIAEYLRSKNTKKE